MKRGGAGKEKRRMPWQRRRNRWVSVFLIFVAAPLTAALIFKAYLAGQVRDLRGELHAMGYAADSSYWDFPEPDPKAFADSPIKRAAEALAPITHEERLNLSDISKIVRHMDELAPEFTEERALLHAIVERNGPMLSDFEAAIRDPANWTAIPRDAFVGFWRTELNPPLEYYRLALCLAMAEGDEEQLYAGLDTACRMMVNSVEVCRLSWAGDWAVNMAIPMLRRLTEGTTLDEARLAHLSQVLDALDITATKRWNAHATIELALSADVYFGPLTGPFAVLGVMDYQVAKHLSLLHFAAVQLEADPDGWWHQTRPQMQAILDEGPAVLTNYIPFQTAERMIQQTDNLMLAEFRVESLKAVIAIERYRRAHGELPDALDALTPAYLKALPLESIDGVPLQYAVTDEGYRVFSTRDERKPERRVRRGGSRTSIRDWNVEISPSTTELTASP